MPGRFSYSRWDGTQGGFELDADHVLAEVTDDLLYHGEPDAALRRVLQSGLRTSDRHRVAGITELLEELRRLRRQELERYDLGAVYEDVARELDEVVRTEREAIDGLAEDLAAERHLRLDLLPSDLAGRLRGLEGYQFTSARAGERFEALLERLRRELLEAQFQDMARALSDPSPQATEALRDMLAELNALLEARAAGDDTGPAFEEFMRRHGHLLPGRPRSLDELLEQLTSHMAAAQSVLNSMAPEQREQLQRLSDQLLEDLDLRWQVDRLRHNLARALPGPPWDRRYAFSGDDPLGLVDAASVVRRLGQMDDLETMLGGVTNPGALADVDVEAVRGLLGDAAARSLEELARLSKLLAEAGLVEQREGRLGLTAKGMRRIGHNALSHLFARLAKDRLGGHPARPTGVGQERSHETKPYQFGDPFHVSIERTVRNALRRRGQGVPVALSAEDFEIDRTESLTRTSTVLMLDLSLSMPMRGNFLAAKKVAMALHALISTRFPRDFLALVGFSEVARELRPRDLPEVSWDFVYGTNMQHGLALCRSLLTRQAGTRQVIMVTDGEPTAHLRPSGEVFFHYPPTEETVEATLTEVARCTREGIRINTFMLDATTHLKSFVQRLTGLNRGRAFFTTPDTLGEYVLVDFIEQKRAQVGEAQSPSWSR